MIRTALILCCLSTPLAAQSFEVGDVVPTLAEFSRSTLENFEYFGEGRPMAQITLAPNEDYNLVVQIEETGFLDDSVEGWRGTYVVTFNGDGWEVLEAVAEQRCYRDEELEWRPGACP